ncbi:hypothetical protein PsorP6_003794 [Peronosclerospora sorghi]|uniref:Uncharacterized protein n=1 Tax=Peronosclerospora sorghi TaxID=230839 RepID=A0ACC0VJ05_9STRA|nr:hypothetical protein PsorP6_003794 [Peronosclerospora sorghi]
MYVFDMENRDFVRLLLSMRSQENKGPKLPLRQLDIPDFTPPDDMWTHEISCDRNVLLVAADWKHRLRVYMDAQLLKLPNIYFGIVRSLLFNRDITYVLLKAYLLVLLTGNIFCSPGLFIFAQKLCDFLANDQFLKSSTLFDVAFFDHFGYTETNDSMIRRFQRMHNLFGITAFPMWTFTYVSYGSERKRTVDVVLFGYFNWSRPVLLHVLWIVNYNGPRNLVGLYLYRSTDIIAATDPFSFITKVISCGV